MMSFPTKPTAEKTFLCKFCGEVWLHWSSVKSLKGVPLPLTDSGQFHNCRLSPWNLQKESRLRAKMLRKSAIKKIEDFVLIDEAQKYVIHLNSRLGYHNLRLDVKQTRQLPGEGMEEL
jgi:hypothetical protein